MIVLDDNINCCGNKTELAESVDDAALLLLGFDSQPAELDEV